MRLITNKYADRTYERNWGKEVIDDKHEKDIDSIQVICLMQQSKSSL